MICGSGGSKSRLAKAAGAGPCGQMRDEKLHAIVARSKFRNQHVQNTSGSDRFWKLICWKSARRCGAKHISKSKVLKTVSVAFWTFRCRFAWQAQGTLHLAKSECNVRVLSPFQLQPLHYTPLHYTTTTSALTITTTLRYTKYNYNYNCNYTTLHYTICITLRYTTIRYTTLHCTALRYTQLHYTTLTTTTATSTLHYINYITLHCATPHYTTPHHTTLTTTTATTATTLLYTALH